MSKKFLANVAYLRDSKTLLPFQKWKKIGKLFYDPDEHNASMFLFGFKQGLCVAKPHVTTPPFLQGDIVIPVDVYEGKIRYLFIGFITTSENEKQDTIYSVNLECTPMAPPQAPAGLWLHIHLDDK